jgi:hypothetical protein
MRLKKKLKLKRKFGKKDEDGAAVAVLGSDNEEHKSGEEESEKDIIVQEKSLKRQKKN